MSYKETLIKNIQKADKDKSFAGSTQYVVDFASGDPIKDTQAIKADSPVFLTKIFTTDKNNYQLEKAGTIVPKTEKAAQALKDCFVKDGKLANTRFLSIDKNCILDINGDNVPHDLNLSNNSRLVIDKGAQIHDASLYGSDIHLASGSKVKDASLEMTNTGSVSYDKDNQMHFTKGPAKVQINNKSQKLYISSLINTNLDDNCKLDTVTISNATLVNSNLSDFVYDGAAFISKDLELQKNPKDLLFVADTTAKDTRVILTNTKAPSVKATLTNSNLKRTVITSKKNSLDVCDSNVQDSILLDDSKSKDKSRHTIINSSEIKGLIMKKPLVADNSSVTAKKNKPIVALGGMDLANAHLSSQKGAIIPRSEATFNNVNNDLSEPEFKPTSKYYKELADLNKAPVSLGFDEETETVQLSEKYLLGHEAFTNTIVDDLFRKDGRVRDVDEIADTIDEAARTVDPVAKERAKVQTKLKSKAETSDLEL